MILGGIMAKNWDYAKMSEMASKHGGPEKWIEDIKRKSYADGVEDAKCKWLVPILFIGMGMGSICTVGGRKIKELVIAKKDKRKRIEQDAFWAEQKLKEELDGVVEGLREKEENNEQEENDI